MGKIKRVQNPLQLRLHKVATMQKKLTNSWGQLENTVAWEIRLGTKNATFLPMELLLSKFLGVADIFPSGIASSACI